MTAPVMITSNLKMRILTGSDLSSGCRKFLVSPKVFAWKFSRIYCRAGLFMGYDLSLIDDLISAYSSSLMVIY